MCGSKECWTEVVTCSHEVVTILDSVSDLSSTALLAVDSSPEWLDDARVEFKKTLAWALHEVEREDVDESADVVVDDETSV